jgi:hypothetical protein
MYHQLCGVDEEISEYRDSLLRFSSNEVNGLNPSQTLQYFFPKRDDTTNSENLKRYKNSQFMYIYRPTSPLYIVNVKIWSANNAKLSDLPESEYFAYNGGIVRTQASDDPTIDNEFYKFILKKINETQEDVDGVYMPAHGTAHEEVVLQQSGVVKLEVIDRVSVPHTVDFMRQQAKMRQKAKMKNAKTTVGRKLNF